MGGLKTFDVRFSSREQQDLPLPFLLQALTSGRIPFSFEARLSGESKWVEGLQISEIADGFLRLLLVANHGSSEGSLLTHWYVSRGEHKYGPLSLLQMMELVQQRRLKPGTLVNHPSRSGWRKLGQTYPFDRSSMEAFRRSESIYSVIVRRQTPRISFSSEIFLSNRGDLYRGVTWSLSEGGVGLLTDQSTEVHQGDLVNIIINGRHDCGPLQLKGRVVHVVREANYDRLSLQFEQTTEPLRDYMLRQVPPSLG